MVSDYASFVGFLKHPRIIYLSLPAGSTVDSVLNELIPFLEKEDVLMDGGNLFYLDSTEGKKRISERGIHFLDRGTNSGLEDARYGACFLVGGKEEDIRIPEPILTALAVNKDGYIHTGQPGTSHFVKLVHNGIESGMLQSIGEGVELLHKSGFELDLAAIFKNWSNGSMIRSCLPSLWKEALESRSWPRVKVT